MDASRLGPKMIPPIRCIRVWGGCTVICPKALRTSDVVFLGAVDIWGVWSPRRGPTVLLMPDDLEVRVDRDVWLVFCGGLLVNVICRSPCSECVSVSDWNDQWSFCVPSDLWPEITGLIHQGES